MKLKPLRHNGSRFAVVGLGAIGCCILLLYCVALIDAASAPTSAEGNMSGMNGFVRSVVDGIRERDNDRLYGVFTDGFNEAANICMGILSENIDGLIKPGSDLSDQEKLLLLSRLTEIKSEMEKFLRDYWDRAATDGGR